MTAQVRCTISILFLLLFFSSAAAAGTPSYTTTYTITVQEDGSAIWQIEYRTLLVTANDSAAFEAYSRDLPSVYLPQVQDLMQHSAAQASVAAARPMTVSNMTGTAAVQTSPTGRYGVVVYTFSWSGFADPGDTLTIGDTFAGGLYLPRENTLIIRYPPGWSVSRAEPEPDDQRDGLTWYGLRSFGPGEPRVVLEKPSFPFLQAAAVILIIITIAGIAVLINTWRKSLPATGDDTPGSGEPADAPLSAEEEAGIESRILSLLKTAGGELYQSEIVKSLDLPKSTVSSAIAGLHARGLVIKVKKGRENLIRLAA